MHMGFVWENLKESDHLEEQSADGTMLKLVLKKTSWKGIGLAHDREQRRAPANYIMRSKGFHDQNFSINCGICQLLETDSDPCSWCPLSRFQ